MAFFRNYFNSLADILDSQYRGYLLDNQNNSDKGELCELFIENLLKEALEDSFRIQRGGKIIDWKGNHSKQLDIILTGKKQFRIFKRKGIYPTESTYAVISVTSRLNKKKLISCLKEFISVPKQNFKFFARGFLSEEYALQTEKIWKELIPYKCVFAFDGIIRGEWIKDIQLTNSTSINPYNTTPDLIIVNKKGFIEKGIHYENGQPKFHLKFISFDNFNYPGFPLCKLLSDINNLSHEEFLMTPRLETYFNKDIEDLMPPAST